jgi:hypothetical protein
VKKISFALMITLLFGSLVAGEPTISIQNLTFDSYLFGGFNRYDVEVTAIIAMLMMVLIVSIPVWCKHWSTLANLQISYRNESDRRGV